MPVNHIRSHLRRGRVIGSTSYSEYQPWIGRPGGAATEDCPDACEIGYTWLAASAQRTRCNTEAKFLLLSHAFEEWNVHRVSLRTDVRNERPAARSNDSAQNLTAFCATRPLRTAVFAIPRIIPSSPPSGPPLKNA